VDVFYREDVEDLVKMSSDEELQYAVQLSKGLLRVELTLKGESAPIAPAAPGADEFGVWKFKPFRGHKRGHHHSWDQDFTKRHHGPFGREGSPFGRGEGPFFGGRGGFGGHPHPAFARGGPHPGPFGMAPPSQREHMQDVMQGMQGEGGRCGKGKFTARHVKDVTIPDGTQLAPGTPFVKTWRIRNEGLDWPVGTRLMFISHKGDNLGGPEFVPITNAVPSGSETELSVNLVAPNEPGQYSAFWRLCDSNGKKFGQRFWCSITVSTNSSSDDSSSEVAPGSELEAKIKTIEELGFGFPKKKIERLLRKYNNDVNMVAAAVTAKLSKGRDDHHPKKHGHRH